MYKRQVLDGAKPDYLVVQHMEPDHAANIENFMKAYPDTTVVANTKTFTMMGNFFRNLNLDGKKLVVANGDSLTLGKHVLTFVFAPMVHWPEVMVTYDSTDKVLFSADGFGKFLSLIHIGLVIIAGLAGDATYQIQEQEQAVLTTFGVPKAVAETGLHFKIPFIQKVQKVNTTIQGFPIGYSMGDNSVVENEGIMITSDYNFIDVDFFRCV